MKEMVRSATAERLGICNDPDDAVSENLERLMGVLDDLREHCGFPLRVTSGYRCPELNRAVGGAAASAHQCGLAADLQNCTGTFEEFVEKCREWARGHDLDQLIIESNRSGRTRWVHLGIEDCRGRRRNMIFSIAG